MPLLNARSNISMYVDKVTIFLMFDDMVQTHFLWVNKDWRCNIVWWVASLMPHPQFFTSVWHVQKRFHGCISLSIPMQQLMSMYWRISQKLVARNWLNYFHTWILNHIQGKYVISSKLVLRMIEVNVQCTNGLGRILVQTARTSTASACYIKGP